LFILWPTTKALPCPLAKTVATLGLTILTSCFVDENCLVQRGWLAIADGLLTIPQKIITGTKKNFFILIFYTNHKD